MKTVVIYRSKTGFTERYARWIAEDLKCDIYDLKQIKSASLAQYDRLIYGGGIMAGQVGGLKKIKGLLAQFPAQKLIVFATGAADADDKINLANITAANHLADEKPAIPFYYFEGGLNYEKMGFFARAIMKMVAKSMARQQGQTVDKLQSYDHTDRKLIAPLVADMKIE